MVKSSPTQVTSTSETNARALYFRLLKYVWRHNLVFGISVIALIVLASTNTAFLATIKHVTDEGFVKQDPTKLTLLPILLFLLLGTRAIAGFVSTFSIRWVSRRVVEDLRHDAFHNLVALPVSFFDADSVGTLTSKLTFDAEQVTKACTNAVITGIRDSLTIVGMIGYMLYLDWRLTMIFTVVVPFMAIYLRRMTPKIRAAGRAVQDTMGDITKIAEESISGQRIVKIFGAEEYEYQRFSASVTNNRKLHVRLIRMVCLNALVVELLAAFALGLVVFYAAGKFTAGEFAAFLGALLMLISPIKSLSGVNEDIQLGLAAAQSLFRLIDSAPELDQGGVVIDKAKGQIEFQSVTFRYPDVKHAAINNLSLKINPGEKVALVGKSGGGKTTLVNLLPRFYEMQDGSLLLDGVDVRQIGLKNLRQQFAMVSQEITLFNDTVFNNIAYGALRATSEEEVVKAAKAAHAWEFIQQLPNGLQSQIGDRGVRLSGGQRQRLAIARAILKNAPILLLDEATSALDTESEQHVQAAFDELMRNRTTIIIAHRLSTIENADRILVLDRGKIVESGNHATLLAQGGHYAKLYNKQFH